jgi:hypothetical protein
MRKKYLAVGEYGKRSGLPGARTLNLEIKSFLLYH